MMRERTRIESAMNGIRKLEREADDAETLWEMAEAEADKGTLAEVEASIRAAVEKAIDDLASFLGAATVEHTNPTWASESR